MDDRSVLVWLYPADWSSRGLAQTTIQLRENHTLQIPPTILTDDGLRSRETTASLDDIEEPPPASQGLRLDLDNRPFNQEGFVFGKDPSCDVVFPDSRALRRAGKRQCAITFDEHDRLTLQDLRSSGRGEGTSVSYDQMGDGKRRAFKWLLSGRHFAQNPKCIEVAFHLNLKFTIVVAHQNLTPENVARFRQATSLAVMGLTLRSLPPTEPGTGAVTPSQAPIFIRASTVGHGSFASVARVWDVSTGQEYARKKPRYSRFNRQDWLNEIAMMQRVSHPNILPLLYAETDRVPAMYLQYMPLGNLEVQQAAEAFSRREAWKILHQGLTGLEYLHSHRIMHRDIKPENFLVAERSTYYDVLLVKLADFGLSQQGSQRDTVCGTRDYVAPEIAGNLGRSQTPVKYTSLVDIWSLGVVALGLIWGLPEPGYGQGLSWCQAIVDEAELVYEYEDWYLTDVLIRYMLVMNERKRCSAATCLVAVATCEPLRDTLASSATPVPGRSNAPTPGRSQNRRTVQTLGSRAGRDSGEGPSSSREVRNAATILQYMRDH